MVAITQRSFAAPPRPPRWATSAPSLDSRSGGPPRRDRPARRARAAPRSRSPCPGAARCARHEPGGSRWPLRPLDPLEAPLRALQRLRARAFLARAERVDDASGRGRSAARPAAAAGGRAGSRRTGRTRWRRRTPRRRGRTRSPAAAGPRRSRGSAETRARARPAGSRAVASWFSERSRPDRPCAEPHEPRAPVAGAAAEVDHVEPARRPAGSAPPPRAPPRRPTKACRWPSTCARARPSSGRPCSTPRGCGPRALRAPRRARLTEEAPHVLGVALERRRRSAFERRRKGSSSRPPSRSFHLATARPRTIANG